LFFGPFFGPGDHELTLTVHRDGHGKRRKKHPRAKKTKHRYCL
jgi:hypothetical protein